MASGASLQAQARLRDPTRSRLKKPRSTIVDYAYLNRRMTEDRQRAADADSEAARRAHLELADYYAAQLEQLRNQAPDARLAIQ